MRRFHIVRDAAMNVGRAAISLQAKCHTHNRHASVFTLVGGPQEVDTWVANRLGRIVTVSVKNWY